MGSSDKRSNGSKEPRTHARALTIEQQIDAVQRGDWEGVIRQASRDVHFEIFAPQEFAFTRTATGAEAFRNAVRHNLAIVEEQRPSITNVVMQGEVVVLFGTEKGRIRATQATYHVEFVNRFTFDGNALASLRIIVARAA